MLPLACHRATWGEVPMAAVLHSTMFMLWWSLLWNGWTELFMWHCNVPCDTVTSHVTTMWGLHLLSRLKENLTLTNYLPNSQCPSELGCHFNVCDLRPSCECILRESLIDLYSMSVLSWWTEILFHVIKISYTATNIVPFYSSCHTASHKNSCSKLVS